jgi:uncharacterized alkaline shock family protein YloU
LCTGRSIERPQRSWHLIERTVTGLAIRDVNATYDALGDLFELFENFLRRLNVSITIKVQVATTLTEIVVKILVELLATLALATRQVKQGILSRYILRQCLVLHSATIQKN